MHEYKSIAAGVSEEYASVINQFRFNIFIFNRGIITIDTLLLLIQISSSASACVFINRLHYIHCSLFQIVLIK